MIGGRKKGAMSWINFAKAYAIKHKMSYPQALKQAGAEYRRLKGK
jgi:hypothetical protein